MKNWIVGACAMVLLSGCGSLALNNDSVVRIGKGSVTTPADLRVILRTKRSENGADVLITCAEPSPDIARLVSSSQNAQISVEGSLSGTAAAGLGYGYSRGRAEGMAQLTDRLATIQLLRDATYRACEAYANGAIDRTAYALIVARSERLMTSLLFGELLAGRKPQQPITMGATSEVDAAVPQQFGLLTGNLDALTEKAQHLTDALTPRLKSEKLLPSQLTPGLLDKLKLPGPAHELAKELLETRKEIEHTQQQALDLIGMATPPSLVPPLAAGQKPRSGGARSGIRPGPRALQQIENAAVEIERVRALTKFAATNGDATASLDGIQVACLTLLGSEKNRLAASAPDRSESEAQIELRRLLVGDCREIMHRIVAVKMQAACGKITNSAVLAAAPAPASTTPSCPPTLYTYALPPKTAKPGGAQNAAAQSATRPASSSGRATGTSSRAAPTVTASR